MKPSIKFSHHYLKQEFPAHKQAKLLEVFRVKLEDLHKSFIEFDTIYHADTDETVDYYPLPKKGDYMVLLLESYAGNGQTYGV